MYYLLFIWIFFQHTKLWQPTGQRKLLENIWILRNILEIRHLSRGIFRTFELRVLTVIDFPKIAGAKGRWLIDCPNIAGAKAPKAPVLNTTLISNSFSYDMQAFCPSSYSRQLASWDLFICCLPWLVRQNENKAMPTSLVLIKQF